MSDSSMFWFHCGRCGALFQAQAGESERRVCAKCGLSPSTGVIEADTGRSAKLPAAKENAGAEPAREKRSVRKRKRSYLMAKLIAGWTLLLALIIFGAKTLWPDAAVSDPLTAAGDGTGLTGQPDAQLDQKFLDDAAPGISATFAGFLGAGAPEQRNQFVRTPLATASRMVRFHSLNPLIQIDPATLRLQRRGLLSLPDGEVAIETHWLGEHGQLYDAVFRRENDDWLLDWEHFARFSEYPWSQFLAGDGPDEAEFRLLARERLAKERRHEDTISLILYAPRFGRPNEPGFQSPEILVSRRSPAGVLLDAAFKAEREGRRTFDSTLPVIDPDDMIRVRVRVRRAGEETERAFEITAVDACHWFSVDNPGIGTEADPEER